MIEEQGRVVAVDGNQIWVETVQQSSCGSCAAKSTCGQGLMSKFSEGKRNHIRLTTDQPVKLGDEVVLGVPENTLVKSALLAYGLPLVLFVLAAAVAESLFELPEVGVILVGLAALISGFALVRSIAGATQLSLQPVILEVLPVSNGTV